MARRIVCNASPLIFLSKIDRLHLLDAYEILIPVQVEAEILKGAKRRKPDGRRIADYLRGRRVSSVKITLLRDLPPALGAGERAAISLALRENISQVLVDEAKARIAARFKGLEPKGTLGVLWEAHNSGLIDRESLESAVFDLINKGYRIKQELLIEFMKRLRSTPDV
jgi:predicted nucleic acid-binding protein